MLEVEGSWEVGNWDKVGDRCMGTHNGSNSGQKAPSRASGA